MSSYDVRRTRRRVGLVASAVALMVTAGTMIAGNAQAAAGCQVAYTVPSVLAGRLHRRREGHQPR